MQAFASSISGSIATSAVLQVAIICISNVTVNSSHFLEFYSLEIEILYSPFSPCVDISIRVNVTHIFVKGISDLLRFLFSIFLTLLTPL